MLTTSPFFSVTIFLKVLLTWNFHQMSVTTQAIHTYKENKTNKFRNEVVCNKIGKKYWTHEERKEQKGMESQDTSRNLSVIRKQSCASSVEINISCFSPNTYSTRMMKMIPTPTVPGWWRWCQHLQYQDDEDDPNTYSTRMMKMIPNTYSTRMMKMIPNTYSTRMMKMMPTPTVPGWWRWSQHLQYQDDEDDPNTYSTRMMKMIPTPTVPGWWRWCQHLQYQDDEDDPNTYSTRMMKMIPTPTVPGWWRWSQHLQYQDDEDDPNTYSTRMMKMIPNTYRTRMMKMIPNTAKQTLDWFQRKRIKLLERPDNHRTRIQQKIRTKGQSS